VIIVLLAPCVSVFGLAAFAPVLVRCQTRLNETVIVQDASQFQVNQSTMISNCTMMPLTFQHLVAFGTGTYMLFAMIFGVINDFLGRRTLKIIGA
jgi:hypothetical protein